MRRRRGWLRELRSMVLQLILHWVLYFFGYFLKDIYDWFIWRRIQDSVKIITKFMRHVYASILAMEVRRKSILHNSATLKHLRSFSSSAIRRLSSSSSSHHHQSSSSTRYTTTTTRNAAPPAAALPRTLLLQKTPSPTSVAEHPMLARSSGSRSLARSLATGSHHPGVGKMVSRSEYLKQRRGGKTQQSGKQMFLRAGLPFLLFSLGAWWVVASAIDGKLKERAAARREVSQSERQALMQEEHDDMMTKLNKAAKADFDNTKRIERPEDILKRRKAERDKRNVWYRRWWRTIKGEE